MMYYTLSRFKMKSMYSRSPGVLFLYRWLERDISVLRLLLPELVDTSVWQLLVDIYVLQVLVVIFL
jgi:hypothetical protein